MTPNRKYATPGERALLEDLDRYVNSEAYRVACGIPKSVAIRAVRALEREFRRGRSARRRKSESKAGR